MNEHLVDAAHKRSKRNSNYKYRYGLTVEQVEWMAEQQGYRCLICGLVPSKGLVVDHAHMTGKTRGLLCHGCNIATGFLRENPVVIFQCAIYVERGRRAP